MRTRPSPGKYAYRLHSSPRRAVRCIRCASRAPASIIGLQSEHVRAVRIEIDVIGHEQVELAVAIIVNPGTAGPPMGSIPSNTSLPGDVGEGAITVVVVKDVLTPIGDKQVFKPVVVVIAH